MWASSKSGVFVGGRLENAVVGGVEDEIEAGDVVADAETRADRVLIDEQLVVIPPKAGAHCKFAKANLILHEGGLFEIGAISGERVGGRRVGIEVIGVGDEAVETFVEEGGVGLDADFDFVAVFVDGDGAFEIALAEIIVLEGDDGR